MRLISVGSFLLLIAVGVSAQTISGVVVDGSGAAIEKANVLLVDRTTVQTKTDVEGRFSITGTISNRTYLIVTADGFATFERRLTRDGVFNFTVVLLPASLNADVTVSITRNETRLSETPASVVALTREVLDSTAAQTIDDALRQIAGFALFRRSSSKTSNPTTQGANLRGVSGSGASRTAVLFDGLSINDAFGGWTYWSRVPQVAVEQVEVLRGGASSLYGSGGLSGAVNLEPIRTMNEGRVFRIQTSAGTQQTFDGGVLAAFSKSGWAFDFASEAFRTDGSVPIASNEQGATDTKASSRHWNILAGSERRFGYFPQRSGSSERKIHGRLFARANLFSEDRDNGTSLTNNATYFRQASAGFDLSNDRIGRVEFRSFLQAQVYDQTFSAVSADRNTETLTRLQRVPSHAAGGQIYWTRVFGDHTIVSSLETRDVRGFSDEIGFFGGQPTSASGSGGKEKTLAFFLQDLWSAGERVRISFGGRYDSWRNRDALSVVRTLPTNAITVSSFPDRSESAISPRVAALVSVNEQVSIYGSYARSFRAPTLNELYRGFRVGNVVTQANEHLRAEIADTIEGGIGLRSFENRMTVRANLFVTTINDPIVSITIASTPMLVTRRRENVGETRARGLELDSEFAIRPELRLSVSYLFVDSRFMKFPADPLLVGNFLPQVARQQLNFQMNYRPAPRYSFGIQGRISSGQFEDDRNTLSLRSYITMDAAASFRLRKGLEVHAAAENVFNSRYDIGLIPNRTVASPFSFRIGLRYRSDRK